MTFLATLQLGKTGFFGESGWFYLELLVLLFSIGAGVLWLIEKRRHRGEKLITPHNPMGSIPAHLLRTKAGRIGKTAIALALGIGIGWIWKAHQDQAIYLQEHEAWKQRSAEIQQLNAGWRTDYAKWKKENR